MFESLKKKLQSWLGKDEEKDKKKSKATKKVEKKKASKVQKPKKTKESKSKPAPVAKVESKVQEIVEVKPSVVAPVITEIEEKEKKTGFGFFARLKNKLTASKITESEFEEIFYELELALLENNLALEVLDAIKAALKTSLVGLDVKKADIEKNIAQALKESIEKVLIEPSSMLEKIKAKKSPFVILFFGINGSGKTTSIAKLANYLKKNKISCVLAAADTFRAASIEQLETHASRLQVPIIKHAYGSDPAAVAFDAQKYAEKNHIDVVLVDTAGRMYTKENLMREMEKIVRVARPDLKIFVGEATTGNDATEQARNFNDTAGIDGIILTKADVDEKGGAALSVSYITKKPIYFLGTGQTYDDFKPFSKKEVMKNLGLE